MVTTHIISHGNDTRPKADLHIDCRHLPNPYTVPALRPRDGRQKLVKDWVLGHQQTQDLIDNAVDQIKPGMTVAVMCNAGRHRSVVVAEEIARRVGAGHTHLNLNPTKAELKQSPHSRRW